MFALILAAVAAFLVWVAPPTLVEQYVILMLEGVKRETLPPATDSAASQYTQISGDPQLEVNDRITSKASEGPAILWVASNQPQPLIPLGPFLQEQKPSFAQPIPLRPSGVDSLPLLLVVGSLLVACGFMVRATLS